MAPRFLLAAGACLCTLAAMPVAAHEPWPRLAGAHADAPACADATLLARAMFDSPAPRIHAPLRLPDGMTSELLLGATEADISGGDALANAGGFDKLAQGDGRSLYWEQAPAVEARIVVREIGRGWRGDQYSLYLPGKDVAPQAFLDALAQDAGGLQSFEIPIDEDWRPPLVFRLRADGSKWFVRIGQPFVPLHEWQVHGVRAGRYEELCTIAFRPDVADVESLLPDSVRTLLGLLDETLGPGDDEGTLQPTAGIRNKVRHVAANAALRPWAVSGEAPYNTRAEVDAGLAAWATNAPRKALRRRILLAGPQAQHALAASYRADFGMPPAQADTQAARVLDVLLRAHYMFPKR